METQYSYKGYTIGYVTKDFSEEEAQAIIEQVIDVRKEMSRLGLTLFDDEEEEITIDKFDDNVNGLMADTKEALQTVWNEINQGQRKQLIKIEKIKTLLDRYGVEY